jgi:hypothetical protein
MPYRRFKDKTGLIVTWKNWITPEGRYVQVYVWESSDYLRKNIDDRSEDDTLAAFVQLPYLENMEEPHDRIIPRKFGEIHIPISKMGAGLVAHELQHFILCWLLTWRLDPEMDNESLCLLSGNITRKFWRSFYRRFQPKT